MEFIKNLFKEDEKIIGLCGFREKSPIIHTYKPELSSIELFYTTNTKNNFLLS